MPRSAQSFETWLSETVRLAQSQNFSDDDIFTLIQYSKNLHSVGCPIIFDPFHLAGLVGFDVHLIYAVSNAPERFYRRFQIKKRSGGLREICEPLPSLKEIQRWILDNILTSMNISPAAKAYFKGASIRANAKFHVRQPVVLKLDVKDFFPNIERQRVYEVFYNVGYTKAVANLLANLCCLNGCLPQGAPTSAALSNVVMKQVDARIWEHAKRHALRFTRYADDLTISGSVSPKSTIRFVRRELNSVGLTLNEEKVQVLRRGARQIVTGVVVNEKLRVPRSVRREFRKNIHYLQKFGVVGHARHSEQNGSQIVDQLIGHANYILSINKEDKDAVSGLKFLRQLKAMDQ